MGKMAEIVTAVVLLNAGTDIRDAETVFQNHGFETEVVVGGSLLISAKPERFQKEFSTEVHQRDDGAFFGTEEVASRSLSLANLPEDVRAVANAIEFQEPPDFGPGNF
jgi:hypothetical protein